MGLDDTSNHASHHHGEDAGTHPPHPTPSHPTLAATAVAQMGPGARAKSLGEIRAAALCVFLISMLETHLVSLKV